MLSHKVVSGELIVARLFTLHSSLPAAETVLESHYMQPLSEPGVEEQILALTLQERQKILDAINSKASGREFLCPVTNDANWDIQAHYGLLLATDQPSDPFTGGGYNMFPNAVLLCKSCGYSLMFNLFTLGLAEEFGIEPTKVAST